jgi:4-hydroxy-tetrahydrodipicolinate reductase
MESLRILLVGANGRMGRAVTKAAESQSNLGLVAHYQRGDVLDEKFDGIDVVIDFSRPDVIESLCSACAKKKVPLVIGTTGHSAQQRRAIEDTARSVPIVFASNFSIGVNALLALTRAAGKILGHEFKPAIVETHHRMKKDAPSGTAKTIAQILQRHDSAEIPIQSIREGDIVGEHKVIFVGPQEEITLQHRAESRAIFARGALRAASWIVGKPAGLYSMEDVLGL